ncbi:Ig-like domain-containing alpha-2-macroglobulin family protein [Stakelama tenebrarum]|uniref:Alpha-2-macroglobulin n=1 Tax=Stakelama tenebrarum TaxID=2711215 RepID=A0A6G6YAN3_9SPHN|nr:Ig-like domain-containing alpha-2-macroglobulin family protein [Sphingosinithalassobacter tenebrarum]QIG81636.1 alpha-2-macroglobulin [Sphingosinithalassobacter tenebrarum]
MRLAARAAILALVLAPLGAVAAFGDDAPEVVVATPGIGNGAIERFTVRFNEPMVPLGDPRAAGPFDVECPVGGQGRWVDQRTFVHEFANPLPGGVTCTFTIKDGLKSLSGYDVEGQDEFTVDSGGPIARAVLPSRWGGRIEEDQVFLIAANLPADPASVAENAYCAVEGIGERIPVDVLDKTLPARLIAELGTERWEVRSFLRDAGLPQALPENEADRAEAMQAVTALKCRRPLPPGRDVSLVWGKDIESASGRAAGSDQRFDFTVRQPFTARWECSRVNPQAGCNPVQDAHVVFTSQVPRELAGAIRLRTPDGKEIAPNLSEEDQRQQTLSRVTFAGPLPADTTASLVMPEGLKDESGRALSNSERFPLEVRIDERPPLVKFAAEFGILELSEGGVLPVTVRNVEAQLKGQMGSVAGQRLRVDGSDAEVARWLRTVEDADDYRYETVTRGDEEVRVNHTGDEPVLTGDAGNPFNIDLPGEGKQFEVVGIPLTDPGFYVVELASPRLGEALLGRDATRYVATAALVTNMTVHFKWGRDKSLVWVTSLDGGRGVGSAQVQISDSCTGQLLARGTTDESGRLAVPPGLPEPESWGNCEEYSNSHPLMISARKDGDFSFTLTSWGEGIRPYDFDLPYGWSQQESIFHTVFDRALVRQGETVHMKHIVRKPVAAGFAGTPGFTGTLRLSHRGSDTKFELPLTIDAQGIGETTWNVPQGAPMGDYDLIVETEGDRIWTEQSVRVDEYRLPTMQATVSGPDEAVVQPKSLPVDLYVGYLSGGAAPNLPVEVRVGYFEGLRAPSGYDGFRFGGRAMTEGVRPMDGDGEDITPDLPPTQTIPVTLGRDGTARTTIDVPATVEGDTQLVVEMDYPDANGEVLTASRRIPVYGSAVRLGVRTDGWMMKEDDLRLKFIALDTDGKPIANQRVSVELYSREILTARRRLIGGFYAYDNQMKTTKLRETCSTRTNELGFAECAMDPGVSGEVYAVASTEDAEGNVARATQSVWLAGEDDWWFGGDNGDRMDVLPEKTEYAAGETARFQVRMPFREATALVTIEREGVLSSFVVGLSGKDPVVEVPMPGGYAPDVYVSVLAVRGRVDGWSLWSANVARDWNLPFFRRDAAKPTATVDLAKPAYRLGIARVKVGWQSHRLDVEVKANSDSYAPRDRATVDVTVKTPEGKPASSANLAFVAVDEALLQLAPNDSWNVLDAMMGERPLSVLTSTAQMQVVGKRHYGRKAVAAGGGGGGPGDLSGLNRTNFEPVLLWKGRVDLDANGHARLQVPLSDALSAFRLVAVATDGTQLFGTGSASVRTQQDLSIYAGVPPMVRTGDKFSAMFTLRNGSDKPMKVTANVALSPAIATGRPLTVDIPAGGAVPVSWNLVAPDADGQLRWTVSARSADGKATDRISVTQQVAWAVPVETWAATLARVGDGTDFPVTPPAGALPGRGSVDIRLTDTLSPPLAGVRDYMMRYPYNCFEQRLSRIIVTGNVPAWNRLSGEIPAFLDDEGLLRYFAYENLRGSEALTAYVLSITAEAGLPVPADSKAKMIAAMKAVLDGRLRHEDYGDVRLQRIAAFAALARNGEATPAMLGQIGMTPADMPTSTLADYLMALGKVPGLANGAQLRAAGEAELRKRLVYEGTRIDLSDKGAMPWWLMASNDQAAIKALLAALGRPGWQEEMAKMMVGVSMRQQRGHWDTTTANAWGAVAARKFDAAYPASAVQGTTVARFGSGTRRLEWPLAEPQRAFSLPLPNSATPLRMTQTGGAGPWAMVQVKAAVPLTEGVNAGYKMTRKTEVVQASDPNRLGRGDVVKVTITVEASAARNWVVISDPVPAGAQVLGGLGGQSELLRAQADSGSGVQPSYVERGQEAWRAYFRWVPRGSFTVSYVMRLNNAGEFHLPPSRVEAMYSPEIFAALPNQTVTVAQR